MLDAGKLGEDATGVGVELAGVLLGKGKGAVEGGFGLVGVALEVEDAAVGSARAPALGVVGGERAVGLLDGAFEEGLGLVVAVLGNPGFGEEAARLGAVLVGEGRGLGEGKEVLEVFVDVCIAAGRERGRCAGPVVFTGTARERRALAAYGAVHPRHERARCRIGRLTARGREKQRVVNRHPRSGPRAQ